MTDEQKPNIIGDIHWRACEYCRHLKPQGGCYLSDKQIKSKFDTSGPELRCGLFLERKKP